MLAHGAYLGGPHDMYTGAYLSAIPKGLHDHRQGHKRASSGSSVASAGPPSPLSQSTLNPRIATSDTYSPLYQQHYVVDDFNKPYAESTTPHLAVNGAKPMSMPLSAEAVYPPPATGTFDMRRMHSSGADTRTSFTTGAQSVSSMSHDSPATPVTNYENEFDEAKAFTHNPPPNTNGKEDDVDMDDLISQYLQQSGYPSVAYQQALQDVFPDSAFAPAMSAYSQPAQPRVTGGQQRSSMMQDRLHAAQQDHLRTQSPTSAAIHRDRSPFKQSSQFVSVPSQPARAPPQLKTQRTSVSPKELMLDDHEIEEPSHALFPDQTGVHTRHTRHTPTQLTTLYTPGGMSSQESTGGIPQQYPFISLHGPSHGAQGYGDTPDFPAHLLSMESTNEEGPSEPASSQQSIPRSVERDESSSTRSSAKPVDTASDAGTYSCTYHGCTLRFDSPAKLQRHKREGHRQQSPSSVAHADRSTQAGPHKCQRVNPSTGKPCNSIFSRPYDLTRHEDTIHNARKQKVRCHLCTEDKTFSRSDALTRHMRVVHPEVDWIGKSRKAKTGR